LKAPQKRKGAANEKSVSQNGLTLLLDQETIARRLRTLAKQIHRELKNGSRPIAVIVLQGGFIFAADLLRRFPENFLIDVAFLRCQSYGSRTSSSGKVILLQDIEPNLDLRGRTVLLIDDILDTGLTMKFLVSHLRRRGARDVKLCVLLDRKHLSGRRRIEAQFAGFPVGREFVVGYGLDFAGKYRHLPYLGALQPAEPEMKSKRRPKKT
jgi:hypoxanthine phosphoribosyltransferase